MPRRSRRGTGGLVFHVINRAVEGLVLFEDPGEYKGFLRLVRDTLDRIPMRVLAYSLMPNHWHLVLWPPDDLALSPFMRLLTSTHAARWRTGRGSRGRGAVYQGRFKAIAVQHDEHFYRLCRYVERNPIRAGLVVRAEDWPWSSASDTAPGEYGPALTPWPLGRPANWHDQLNAPEPAGVLEAVRTAIRKGTPYGSERWRSRVNDAVEWRTGRRAGRPPVDRRNRLPQT